MIYQILNKNTSRLIISIFSFLSFILLIPSCKPSDNSKKLLTQALKNKDYATAVFAYNNLLLNDTTNFEYKDSLARLYIRSGNFEGGLRLGEQVIVKYPKNLKLLELVGVANEQMKNTDKSISIFNSLFKSTQNYKYMYKIASIYFDNNKFAESDSIAELLIAQVPDTSKKIDINVPNEPSQSVPIIAASYNLKGAILTELAFSSQNKEIAMAYAKKAIQYFNQALGIKPDFTFPQMYLQKIYQAMAQTK